MLTGKEVTMRIKLKNDCSVTLCTKDEAKQQILFYHGSRNKTSTLTAVSSGQRENR